MNATPLWVLCGPTAAGKSQVALDVAERVGGEIVSADSQQVYRGFDIGTAKPGPEERRRVPHHLIDMAAPEEQYTAGRFRRDALEALRDIEGRGRQGLVVGGTGLYISALLGELPLGVPRDSALRSQLESDLRRRGLAALHADLVRRVPEASARVRPSDPVRTVRALELLELTGNPWPPRPASVRPAVIVGLDVSPEVLRARIDARAEAMIRAGLVAEVQALLARHPAAAPAFRGIGYAEAVAHLQGSLEEDLATAIARRTRAYARRQRTWFRNRTPALWVSADAPDIASQVIARFREGSA